MARAAAPEAVALRSSREAAVHSSSTTRPVPPLGEGGHNASRPNLLLLLADDMGYSDIGCFGAEIRTPNLDRLAAGGLVFTQAYNSARCCPSRAALITGLYPHQAGIGHMVHDFGLPGYQGRLSDNCVTLAEPQSEAPRRMDFR